MRLWSFGNEAGMTIGSLGNAMEEMMQTGKRIVWLTVFALVALVGNSGAPALGVEKETTTKTSFLDRLKVGEPVAVEEKDGRYQLTIFIKGPAVLDHTIVEFGSDYVAMRDLAGITDLVVPIYSIRAIRVMRVPIGK
jgi:hypothetical protein